VGIKRFKAVVNKKHWRTALQLFCVNKGVMVHFLPNFKCMLLSNTTDGADSTKLLSKLLGHECLNHCPLPSFIVDCLLYEQNFSVMRFIEKCQLIVLTLHVKGHITAYLRFKA
jgi:hypothetical protein